MVCAVETRLPPVPLLNAAMGGGRCGCRSAGPISGSRVAGRAPDHNGAARSIRRERDAAGSPRRRTSAALGSRLREAGNADVFERRVHLRLPAAGRPRTPESPRRTGSGLPSRPRASTPTGSSSWRDRSASDLEAGEGPRASVTAPSRRRTSRRTQVKDGAAPRSERRAWTIGFTVPARSGGSMLRCERSSRKYRALVGRGGGKAPRCRATRSGCRGSKSIFLVQIRTVQDADRRGHRGGRTRMLDEERHARRDGHPQ